MRYWERVHTRMLHEAYAFGRDDTRATITFKLRKDTTKAEFEELLIFTLRKLDGIMKDVDIEIN